MRSPVLADGERPMSPLAAAVWSIVLGLIDQVCVALTEGLRPGSLTDIVNVTACDVLATSVVVWLVLRLYAPETSVRAALGVRPPAVLEGVLAIAVGAGMAPLLLTVDDMVLRRFPYEDPDALENMSKLVERSPRVALVLGAFVVIPIARELFFRGVLYGRLRALGPSAAVVATAVFAGCSSLDVRAIPSALVLSFALSLVRAATGSVVPAIVGHLSFWAVEGVPILRGRDPAADVTYPPSWIAAGAAISLAALVIQWLRRPADVD